MNKLKKKSSYGEVSLISNYKKDNNNNKKIIIIIIILLVKPWGKEKLLKSRN